MKTQKSNGFGENAAGRSFTILDSIDVPVFVLNHQKTIYANPAARRWLRQDEAAGLPDDLAALLHLDSDARACLEQALQQALAGAGGPLTCDAQARDAFGGIFAVHLSIQKLGNAALLSAEPDPYLMVTLTVRPPDTAAHERERELLEMIFTTDPGGMAVISGPELTFRLINPAYRMILPDPKSDPIGRPYAEVWGPVQSEEQIQRFREILENHRSLDLNHFELVYPDGMHRYADVHIRPLSWNGEPGVLIVGWDITDLERALDKAGRRAAELDTVLNSLPDAIIIYGEDGCINAVNPAAREMFGFDPVGVSRETLLERVQLRHQNGRRITIEELPGSRGLKNQRVNNLRMQLTNAQGQVYQLSASAAPLVQDGRLVGSTAVWTDVSEVVQRRQEMEALVQVAGALRNTILQEEMFPVTLDQIMDLMKVDGASLLMPDAATGDLVVRAAAGAWKSTLGQRLLPGEGLSSNVMADGEPILDNDIQKDTRLARTVFVGNLCCGACVPLHAHDSNIGVVWVGRNAPISNDELPLLMAIADIAASSLHRARLFEQTQLRFQRLSALHSIDMAITSSLDLQLTLSVLLDQVVSQMKVDAADILFFDPALQWLEFGSGRGFILPSARPETQRLADTPAGQVALERRVVLIPDLDSADLSTEAWLSPQEGFKAYFGAPLISKGQVKGVIELYQRETFSPDAEWLEFLTTLATQAAIALDNAELFTRLQHSNEDLQQAYDATIEGWARALELRDRETEGHSRRVTEMTIRLARRMNVNDEDIAHMRRGVLLHDIGKMAIPDSILLKDGPLTPEDQEVMRLHPVYAYDLLKPIAYLRQALDIPYAHHEWWDGRGYPRGLRGEEIPLSARIFTVIDVYDALRSDRTYRPRWPEQKVLEYIRARAGTQFDPQVVDAFIKMNQGFDTRRL